MADNMKEYRPDAFRRNAGDGMIWLTRLGGVRFVVNADLVKYVEETPDTIVTLRDGEKILVQETAETVVTRAIEYARATRFPPESA